METIKDAGKNINWQIPENIKIGDLPEFPIECMPGVLKQYVIEISEELQVPLDMVATSVIASLALCNQGKYVVEGKEGWLEPLNIYAVNIARPSERKSPTMAKIIKPIQDFEAEENEKRKVQIRNSKDMIEMYENKLKKLKGQYGSNKKSESEIEKEVANINQLLADYKPVKPFRLLVDDITLESLASVMADNKERVGIFSSEGGIFDIIAGRYSNNIANFDILLKAYSGDRTSIDRKGSEAEILEKPYLTILLFVQPVVAENIFRNEQFKGKGLCARFLYCYPKSKVGNRNVNSKAASKETTENYNNIIKKLLKKNTEKFQILKLSSEAYSISQTFAERLEIKLKNELEDIDEWAGKFHGNILRIAGNIHLAQNIDTNNLIISGEIMLKAIEIGAYYLLNAKNIYKIIDETPDKKKSRRIIAKLKEKRICGIIKKYDLYKACRGKNIQKVNDIDGALEFLIETGYIKVVESDMQEGKIGRPSDKLIELNPYIFN